MLDGSDRNTVTADPWSSTQLKTSLPSDHVGFFACQGPTPGHYDSRRSFHRFYLRQKAVLRREGERLGVFTKDISRRGIGILAPVQLLPKERIDLEFPDGRCYRLEVARCRRLDVGCYECGTRFVLSPDAEMSAGGED